MPVTYTVVSKRPGGMAGENSPKYYPALTDRRVANLRDVADLIAQRSSLSRADVMAAIYALVDVVPELLQDGRNVRLDDFGTFSLHVSGVGKSNPDDVTVRDITKVKMTFLPDVRIKGQLKRTTFVKKKRR